MFVKTLGCSGSKGAIVQSLKQRQWRYIIPPTINNNNSSLSSCSSVKFWSLSVFLLFFVDPLTLIKRFARVFFLVAVDYSNIEWLCGCVWSRGIAVWVARSGNSRELFNDLIERRWIWRKLHEILSEISKGIREIWCDLVGKWKNMRNFYSVHVFAYEVYQKSWSLCAKLNRFNLSFFVRFTWLILKTIAKKVSVKFLYQIALLSVRLGIDLAILHWNYEI